MAHLNSETSIIAWQQMQTFFANGNVVFVDGSLDLIEVAAEFALNNTAAFSAWMSAAQVGLVSDRQAQEWFESDVAVWAVVVAPWVLVQPVKTGQIGE